MIIILVDFMTFFFLSDFLSLHFSQEQKQIGICITINEFVSCYMGIRDVMMRGWVVCSFARKTWHFYNWWKKWKCVLLLVKPSILKFGEKKFFKKIWQRKNKETIKAKFNNYESSYKKLNEEEVGRCVTRESKIGI